LKKAAGILTCIVLFLTACTPAPLPALKVGTNIWPGYEPLYLAHSLGLFKATGIKLIEYPSSTDVLRGMRDGVIDAAALTLDEALTLLQDDDDLRVVLVMDVSQGADAVVAARDVQDVAALKGRRVGAETSALGAYMVSRMLDQAGLSAADIELLPLTLDEHEQAFRSHRVDAVVTFEPVLGRLLAAGGHVIYDSSRMPGEIVDVLLVRRSVVSEQKKTLHALIRHWFTAVEHLQTYPDDAAARMQGRLGVAADRVMLQYRGLKLPNLEENRNLLSGLSPRLAVAAGRLSQAMLDSHLLRKPVALEGFFDARCLPEGQP